MGYKDYDNSLYEYRARLAKIQGRRWNLIFGIKDDRISVRANPYHDPTNGRFTSRGGAGPTGGKTALVSGALNPNSERAAEHAERYYEEVRHMTTDVGKVAKTTGYSEKQIQNIKNYIFIDKHDLGEEGIKRFDSSFEMAESWKRLALGKPEPHDLTMIKHEIMESHLVEKGHSQDEAHRMTSKIHNYSKEAKAFYGNIEKHKKGE